MPADELRSELRKWAQQMVGRKATDDELIDAMMTLAADSAVRLYGRATTAAALRDLAQKVESAGDDALPVPRWH